MKSDYLFQVLRAILSFSSAVQFSLDLIIMDLVIGNTTYSV